VEGLKEKLFKLHFLLTEKETEETVRQGLDQFKSCFVEAMSELSTFLLETYDVHTKNNNDIVEQAFEYKLVNAEMAQKLKVMANDFEQIDSTGNNKFIHKKIQESYAGYLQMIYDMLSRMGQDAEEE